MASILTDVTSKNWSFYFEILGVNVQRISQVKTVQRISMIVVATFVRMGLGVLMA